MSLATSRTSSSTPGRSWRVLRQQIVKGVLNVIFNDLAPFVVNTIREAAAAIETVFSAIMQGLDDVYDEIKKVVAWIKMLFDWNDILVTHEVIRFCVNSAFTQIPLLAKDFQSFVDGQFTSARTKITNNFNNLEAYFAPGVTFNAAVNSLGSNPGSGSGSPNSLDGNATTTAHAQNAANANYVSSKSTAYYSSPSATVTQGGLQAGLQSTDLVSAIISQVATNWATVLDSVQFAKCAVIRKFEHIGPKTVLRSRYHRLFERGKGSDHLRAGCGTSGFRLDPGYRGRCRQHVAKPSDSVGGYSDYQLAIQGNYEIERQSRWRRTDAA